MSENKVTQGSPLLGGYTGKDFSLNVLNGMAVGIVLALIPNAALGGVLDWLIPNFPALATMKQVAVVFQFLCAPLIGVLVGINFKFNPLEAATLGLVALAACGNIKAAEAGFAIAGIGDLLNVLLFVAIAVVVTFLVRGKFGSLTIVLHPVVVALGVGTVAALALPAVGSITKYFGTLINNATTLQPYLMAPILSMAFCFAVTSPLSSVALGLITGVSGLAAGASNLGVACAATFLIVSAWRANSAGVPIAIFFGGIKMMLPNLFAKPVLFLPMLVTAGLCGLLVPMFNLLGDAKTAGFGYISLIGPLKAAELGMSWASIAIVYFAVPYAVYFAVHVLCTKVLKLYTNEDMKFGLGKK